MITSSCAECGVRMSEGVLKHSKGCSGKLFERNIQTDYIRPPAMVLNFDSPEEQAEWLRKLKVGSGERWAAPKASSEAPTAPQDSPEPNYQQYICKGAHCKCMNLDGKCPGYHNGDHTCPTSTKQAQDSGEPDNWMDESIKIQLKLEKTSSEYQVARRGGDVKTMARLIDAERIQQATPDSESHSRAKKGLSGRKPCVCTDNQTCGFHAILNEGRTQAPESGDGVEAKKLVKLLDKYWDEKADCLSDDGCNVDHEAKLEAAIELLLLQSRIDELETAYTAHPGINTEYLDQRIAELQFNLPRKGEEK